MYQRLTFFKDRKFLSYVVLVFLILAAWRFLHGYQEFYGVDPYDESLYLQFAGNGNFRSAWSPLYLVYYRVLLTLFSGDALRSYYFNIGLLSFSLPILHYLLLRRLSVSPLLSFLSSYYILIGSFNAPLIPKSGHFNLVFIYLGLIVVCFLRDEILQYAIVTAVMVFSIFIRQEMVVVAGISLLALIAVIWRNRQRISLVHVQILFYVVDCTAALFIIFGNVFGQSRSWQVFSNTFFYNAAPGAPYNHVSYAGNIFGPSESIFRALLSNPAAFLWHVKTNLKSFPSMLWPSLMQHFPLVSGSLEPAARWESLLVLSLVVVMIALAFFIRSKQGNWRWRTIRSLDAIICLICLGLLIKTMVIVGVFWSGTPRYFLDGIFAFLILLTFFLDRLIIIRSHSWLTYGVCAALLIFVPNHERCADCNIMSPVTKERSAKEMIRYMRQLEAGYRTCFLTGSYDVFLGPSYRCTPSGSSWARSYPSASQSVGYLKDFRSYLNAMKFDYVLVSRPMRDEMREFGKEEELNSFLENYKEWGFRFKHETKPGEFVFSR